LETTGYAGGGTPSALASSIERSESLIRNFEKGKPIKSDFAHLRAARQVMQKKELSVRLKMLAGTMPF